MIFFSVWILGICEICLPFGLFALRVIPSFASRSRPMMLIVLLSTISTLHCFADHEPDFMSRLSTPRIWILLLLKHLYFVNSLYGWIVALGIFSDSSIDFSVFISDLGEPVSAIKWSFFCIVNVSTQNSPSEFLFRLSFDCLWNSVGRTKLMFAQINLHEAPVCKVLPRHLHSLLWILHELFLASRVLHVLPGVTYIGLEM